MKTFTVTFVEHVVILREYERGWGSKDFHAYAFDTKEDAMKKVHQVNSENTEPNAPDYYIQARYEERVLKSVFDELS